uniref:Uncharacterized protein n=1 Tax=Rhizophora mucronata TaxID=61149 RepID=A0A2P2R4J1_RHIMU
MSHGGHRESDHHDQSIVLTHIFIDSPTNNVPPSCSHGHHHQMSH